MTQLANELELIGWSVHRAKGPDAKLEVVPADSRVGIQQIALRLRRSILNQAMELGSAKLLLDSKVGAEDLLEAGIKPSAAGN